MNCVIEKEIVRCSSPEFFMLLCVFRCTPRAVGNPCCCDDTTSKAKMLCYRVWANILYLTSIIQFVYTFPFSWKYTILPLDFNVHFSSVQSLSHVWLFETLWTTARQASLSITNSWSLIKLISIESVMPCTHLILCCPLLLLPSVPPSIRVFSNESALHIRWPNIGVSASTSVLPMNTQDWSPLGWTGWISLQSKGLSRVFSHTIVQKHQFFGAQLSSQSNSHIHTWLLEKP